MTTTATARPATHAEEPLPLSIRVLRRMNPLLVRLLRSRAHGLLSRDLLVLTYTGRRSGRRYTLPLSYVMRGTDVGLCTRSSRWVENLRGGARVEVTLRGHTIAATAELLDPESPDALDGLRAFLTRHPRTGELLYEVRRGADGRPREDDLVSEVLRSGVVRVKLDDSAS